MWLMQEWYTQPILGSSNEHKSFHKVLRFSHLSLCSSSLLCTYKMVACYHCYQRFFGFRSTRHLNSCTYDTIIISSMTVGSHNYIKTLTVRPDISVDTKLHSSMITHLNNVLYISSVLQLSGSMTQ